MIFTVPDRDNERARPQKIEQKGQERISRLAARNGRALRSRRYTATKLTVGIVPAEDAEATDIRRWFSKEQIDIRDDIRVTEEVLAFISAIRDIGISVPRISDRKPRLTQTFDTALIVFRIPERKNAATALDGEFRVDPEHLFPGPSALVWPAKVTVT